MVQRIKELCKGKGITIAELERRCGIGNGIISRWKASKPSYDRLAKVASELDTTVEYLQTGKTQKEPTPEEPKAADPVKQQLYEIMEKMSRGQLMLLLEKAQNIENL